MIPPAGEITLASGCGRKGENQRGWEYFDPAQAILIRQQLITISAKILPLPQKTSLPNLPT